MKANYKKLWFQLIDRKMKKTELAQLAGIHISIFSKMNRKEFVSMNTLARICLVLDCDIGDIVSFEKEPGDWKPL